MSERPSHLETPVGFGKLVGYRLTRWRPDEAELELALEPRHLNRSNVPHGGVIATLIDTACGFAGCYSAEPGRRRRAVTLALNTSFIGQAEANTTLTAKARRTGGGQTVFFARGAHRCYTLTAQPGSSSWVVSVIGSDHAPRTFTGLAQALDHILDELETPAA